MYRLCHAVVAGPIDSNVWEMCYTNYLVLIGQASKSCPDPFSRLSTDASVDFGDPVDFDLRSHLTLEMWVHPKALPEVREIGVMGKGFNSYLLSFTGHVWFYIDGGSNHCGAEHGLEQWYHVVAVYDRQNMNFYLDGKFVDQRPMVHPVAQGGNFFFRPPLPSDGEIEKPWSFMLDDVRIYSRALSAMEVARHFEDDAAGKEQTTMRE